MTVSQAGCEIPHGAHAGTLVSKRAHFMPTDIQLILSSNTMPAKQNKPVGLIWFRLPMCAASVYTNTYCLLQVFH